MPHIYPMLKPIHVRLYLAPAEWRKLKALARRGGYTTQGLVTLALRAMLKEAQ